METAEQILARELTVAVAWLRTEARFREEEGKAKVAEQMNKQADHWEKALIFTGHMKPVEA